MKNKVRKTFSVEIKEEKYNSGTGTKYQLLISSNGFQTMGVSDLFLGELAEIQKCIQEHRRKVTSNKNTSFLEK